MTPAGAIKILAVRDTHGVPTGNAGGIAEACDLAIEALTHLDVAHWIFGHKECLDYCNCSNCGNFSLKPTKYCPNCGSKMEEHDGTS